MTRHWQSSKGLVVALLAMAACVGPTGSGGDPSLESRADSHEDALSISPGGINWALTGTVTATTTNPGYPVGYANDGDRTGAHGYIGGYWWQGTNNVWSVPDSLMISWNTPVTIDQINLFSVQDNYTSPVYPNESPLIYFTNYGITGCTIQYLDQNGVWQTIANSQGYYAVQRTFTFAPVTTAEIKVTVNDSPSNGSNLARIVELEAWGPTPCNLCSATDPCTTTCTLTEGVLSGSWNEVVPSKSTCGRMGKTCASASPPAQVAGVNWAASANGATATASSSNGANVPANAIDGNRMQSANWTGYWNDGTAAPAWGDWLEVDFAGGVSRTISEVDLFGLQGSGYVTPTPALAGVSGANAITSFNIQYWTGSAWQNVPGGSVTGSNRIWSKLSFAPVSTSKIRAVVNGTQGNVWSTIVELEAWDVSPSGVNVAAAANGGSATASTSYSTWGIPANAIDGERSAWNYGTTSQGAWVSSANISAGPQILAVNFSGNQSISEIDLFSLQDNYTAPASPTLSLAGATYVNAGFTLQYCAAGTTCTNDIVTTNWQDPANNWTTVPGGAITNNSNIWRKVNFNQISASKIRVVVTGASYNGYITEIEAWARSSGFTAAAGGTGAAGALSSDYRTAMAERHRMLGVPCGNILGDTIAGVPGYYQFCSGTYITWSLPTGAQAFDDGTVVANRYKSSGAWAHTADMDGLGWPTQSAVGNSSTNNYMVFQQGILANVYGGPAYRIGGLTATTGGANYAAVNAAFMNRWLGSTMPEKYPASDTVSKALDGASCANGSLAGDYGFYFHTQNNSSSGQDSTFTVGGSAPTNAFILGDWIQDYWKGQRTDGVGSGSGNPVGGTTIDCAHLTSLGWPTSDEVKVVATDGTNPGMYSKFERGQLIFEEGWTAGSTPSRACSTHNNGWRSYTSTLDGVPLDSFSPKCKSINWDQTGLQLCDPGPRTAVTLTGGNTGGYYTAICAFGTLGPTIGNWDAYRIEWTDASGNVHNTTVANEFMDNANHNGWISTGTSSISGQPPSIADVMQTSNWGLPLANAIGGFTGAATGDLRQEFSNNKEVTVIYSTKVITVGAPGSACDYPLCGANTNWNNSQRCENTICTNPYGTGNNCGAWGASIPTVAGGPDADTDRVPDSLEAALAADFAPWINMGNGGYQTNNMRDTFEFYGTNRDPYVNHAANCTDPGIQLVYTVHPYKNGSFCSGSGTDSDIQCLEINFPLLYNWDLGADGAIASHFGDPEGYSVLVARSSPFRSDSSWNNTWAASKNDHTKWKVAIEFTHAHSCDDFGDSYSHPFGIPVIPGLNFAAESSAFRWSDGTMDGGNYKPNGKTSRGTIYVSNGKHASYFTKDHCNAGAYHVDSCESPRLSVSPNTLLEFNHNAGEQYCHNAFTHTVTRGAVNSWTCPAVGNMGSDGSVSPLDVWSNEPFDGDGTTVKSRIAGDMIIWNTNTIMCAGQARQVEHVRDGFTDCNLKSDCSSNANACTNNQCVY